MTGENIICFAKDWGEVPTSNNHVMLQLARQNRVLWLNSVATRTPDLRSGRDLRRMVAKLRQFCRGLEQPAGNLWVYTPIVVPLPHSPIARWLNVLILKASLAVIRRRLGFREFQLWTFIPNVSDCLGRLGESLAVYYCVDEWSKFTYVDGPRTAAAEEAVCRKADLVFAVSRSLVEDKSRLNPRTFLALHGVDHAMFAQALDPATRVPADIASIRPPVLGFYGTVQDWIDLDLIAALAARHPEWSIVMIGDIRVDVRSLRQYPNIHFLGRRPHTELPAYCKAFTVGLIPYLLTERILTVNPIKLREYLSAGVPVVSTGVPEARHYPRHCRIADTAAEFEAAIQQMLGEDTPEARRRRSAELSDETWERRVAAVVDRVAAYRDEKRHAHRVRAQHPPAIETANEGTAR